LVITARLTQLFVGQASSIDENRTANIGMQKIRPVQIGSRKIRAA
jgi:hypothetical protein